jgi:hypothetical protein
MTAHVIKVSDQSRGPGRWEGGMETQGALIGLHSKLSSFAGV